MSVKKLLETRVSSVRAKLFFFVIMVSFKIWLAMFRIGRIAIESAFKLAVKQRMGFLFPFFAISLSSSLD